VKNMRWGKIYFGCIVARKEIRHWAGAGPHTVANGRVTLGHNKVRLAGWADTEGRFRPRTKISIVKLFYFSKNLLSFQTPLNQFKTDLNLNGFYSILKPRTLNQYKIKCRWHENATTNYINPKLI
jgi:hypothetical protein